MTYLSMMDSLRELEEVYGLNPVQKILLTTDGSITRILMALTGEDVSVKTVTQEVVSADDAVAEALDVAVGVEVNYRVVNLLSGGRVLVHAVSYAPLSRLKSEFREDIMRRDVPIGTILARLKIEARREIKDFSVIKADPLMADVFGLLPNALLLKRSYDIITGGRVLMCITEVFRFDI